MFCPTCGNALPDGAQFCGSCGASLTKKSNASYPTGTDPTAVNYANPAIDAVPDTNPVMGSLASDLSQLDEQRKQGYITQAEFEQRKAARLAVFEAQWSQMQAANSAYPAAGGQTAASTPGQAVYAQPGQVAVQAQDTGSFGWAVLGFFFPLVGLILYIVWKDDKPLSAKKAGVGALVGVIASIVFSILGAVLAVAIPAAMLGSASYY